MRGGFLLGTIVGAAAAAVWLSRRNSNMNFMRMGQMVTSAIGDGFKMMGTNKQAEASEPSASKQAASGTTQKTDKKADQQQLEQMIAKDANVQKEVNEILSQNTH